jgi:hypothetical protein
MLIKIVSYSNLRIESLNVPPITINELRSFIGLLILFGLSKKSTNTINEIWCESSVFFFKFAQITMARRRFQLITQNISFDDIRTRQSRKSSKFHKMEEIFNMFKKNIKLVVPSSNLCVDEELYAFRGRCPFRQYMPKKPNRYGIKYWCLVDVQTTYLLDVNIYLGKANANTPRDKDVGQKAVLKLCEPFFNSNRCVTADNFFTSVVLAQILWTQNLLYVGTMRTNRNVIPQRFLVNKNRLAESSCFAFCDYLTLTSYVPGLNKVVVLLSTMHHDKKVN